VPRVAPAWPTHSTASCRCFAIFDKLELSHTNGYSRRVLAVLRYLGT
jgi:hypothetical protein